MHFPCFITSQVSQLILSSSTKDSEFPLMYTWHEKHYLGAAHGLAGILTVLLQVIKITSMQVCNYQLCFM